MAERRRGDLEEIVSTALGIDKKDIEITRELNNEKSPIFYVCGEGDFIMRATEAGEREGERKVIPYFKALKQFSEEHGGAHGWGSASPGMFVVYGRS